MITPSVRSRARTPRMASLGESSGAVRSEGSSSTASAGLPSWIAASVLAYETKGCGRADREFTSERALAYG